jgi:hypothetical protein
VGEVRTIEPPPPMGINLGSTESAMEIDAVSPRTIKARHDREIFMGAPRTDTLVRNITTGQFNRQNYASSIGEISFVYNSLLRCRKNLRFEVCKKFPRIRTHIPKSCQFR